ncbi:MAG TPA: hypothetical protein VG826_30255 [Pirellulales bacterium]|nr:hypothetical protein [Pirellulales bacterium]
MKQARRLLAALLVLSSVAQAEGASPKRRAYVSGGWNVLETENFRFCSRGRLELSDALLESTEQMRASLADMWLGEERPQDAWQPKCDIILHSTSRDYLRAVPGGDQTVGSSLINTDKGRVVGRRIDIRADRSGWLRAALGHEMTHVVLADRFSDGALPAWADEGMAVLADPNAKQDAHSRDLHVARSRRSTFRLVELFALNGYPSPERQAAFYGQSASLVRFLVARGTPAQFVDFMRAAGRNGYEVAVREVYGMQGVRDLEHRWLQEVSVAGALAENATSDG